jgi:hypothetical protein
MLRSFGIYERTVAEMSKREYFAKKNKKSEEVESVEVETNVEGTKVVPSEPTDAEILAEEREKCEAMSKSELIDYAICMKENFDGSIKQRDILEKSINPLRSSNKELSLQNEDLKKANDELADKLAEAESRIANYELEVGKAGEQQERIKELEETLKNKEGALKRAESEYDRSVKMKENRFDETVKKLQDELKEAKAEIKTLKADLKKAEKMADSSVATADALKSQYLEDNLREELMREDEEAVNARIDAFFDKMSGEIKDLKADLKTERAERFQAKRQIMADEAAEREEKAKNAEEIRKLKESLVTLQRVIEAKEAEEA